MTRVVVDTNALASFLTNRNVTQQAKAAAILEAAARRQIELVVPQVVLTELAYVLLNLYGVSREETAGILRDLLALPGLRTVDALPWTRLFELWPVLVPDLADAALIAICEGERCDSIATFDMPMRRRMARLEIPSYW